MSRSKKARTGLMTVLERKPKKQELLADPDSKESRRKKNLAEKKKHKSVYQKVREQEQSKREQAPQQAQRGGRLADKIKALNKEKSEQGEA
ncbi:MAG: hypothetical protein ACPG4U_03155 [Pseudomonadales bacterium]